MSRGAARRGSRRVAALLTVAATFGCLLVLPPQPSWAAMSADRRWDLGNGVTLQRWSDPGLPIHAFVLKFKPASTAATLDVAMPTPHLPGEVVTSRIGARHRAMAAINGDFGHDRPNHATAVDGRLVQTGVQHGDNFAISANEQRVFIDDGHPHVSGSGPTGPFHVARWNSGPPSGVEIAGFSPEGGSLEDPPGRACSVRLKPTGGPFWTAGKRGVGQRYVVDASRCRRRAMRQKDMTVLSIREAAPRRNKRVLRAMRPGQSVSVRWTMGWPGVLDTVGGRPVLVRNGHNVAPTTCPSFLCGKNPRTGIGVDAHGNLMLVVVDGRIPNWSIGMYLREFGGFFAGKLNARFALNLDGGGSTTMWVKKNGPWCSPKPTGVTHGCIVNYANVGTGYKERPVEDAVLILPGADRGEAAPAGP
jgi:Phosphodiester glycosidase